jgi:hypothetical protein
MLSLSKRNSDRPFQKHKIKAIALLINSKTEAPKIRDRPHESDLFLA